jgi:hypothetical protein
MEATCTLLIIRRIMHKKMRKKNLNYDCEKKKKKKKLNKSKSDLEGGEKRSLKIRRKKKQPIQPIQILHIENPPHINDENEERTCSSTALGFQCHNYSVTIIPV